MPEQKPLRIFFFADWRAQPLRLIENLLDFVGDVDLIVYGGDDLERFFKLDFPNEIMQSLINACKRNVDTHDLKNHKEIIQLASKLLDRTPLDHDDSAGRWDLYRIKRLFITIDDGNYLTKIANKARHGVVAIHGNDGYPEWGPLLSVPGVRDIHVSPIEINGWGFIGIQGHIARSYIAPVGKIPPNAYHNDCQVIEHIEKSRSLINIDPNNLIIVSHTPPLGIYDAAIRYGFQRIGSPSLKQYIKEQKPAAVLCGHVHSGGGKNLFLGDTMVVNGSSNDEDIKRTNAAIIDLIPGQRPNVQWIDPRPHHVIFAPSIGLKRADILANHGIHYTDELRNADDTIFKEINFGKIRKARIKALHLAFKENRPIWIADKMELPDNLIFYDVETGFSGDSDYPQEPWMIGVLVAGETKPLQWCVPDEDSKARKKMYQEFLQLLKKHPDAILCSWSGKGFDDRIIKTGLKRWEKHGLRYWDDRFQIDLCKVFKECLVFPAYDFSIKTVARCCEFMANQTTSDIDGFDIALAYELYRKHQEPLDINSFLLYNADDVFRLDHLAQWYRSQNPS